MVYSKLLRYDNDLQNIHSLYILRKYTTVHFVQYNQIYLLDAGAFPTENYL
jgi:hypothetical protein